MLRRKTHRCDERKCKPKMTSRCGDANTKTQNIRECKITAPPQRGDAKQQSATDRSATKKHRIAATRTEKHRIAATRNKNKAANKKNHKKIHTIRSKFKYKTNSKSKRHRNAATAKKNIALLRRKIQECHHECKSKIPSHCDDSKTKNATHVSAKTQRHHNAATKPKTKCHHQECKQKYTSEEIDKKNEEEEKKEEEEEEEVKKYTG